MRTSIITIPGIPRLTQAIEKTFAGSPKMGARRATMKNKATLEATNPASTDKKTRMRV